MNQDEFGTNCAVDKHAKISVKILISVDNISGSIYRSIISVDRYIGQSLIQWYNSHYSSKQKGR